VTHLRDVAMSSSYKGGAFCTWRLGRRGWGGAVELAAAPIAHLECQEERRVRDLCNGEKNSLGFGESRGRRWRLEGE
jgi:hypothetical protein